MDCGARAATCGVLWSRSVAQPSRWIGTCPDRWLTGKLLPSSSKPPPGHLVEAELAQEDAQPPFPGDPRRYGLGRTGAFDPALEVLPDLQQVQPGPGGLPPDRLAALKAVGLRPGAWHLRVAGGDAAEQVGGEQAADDLQGAERGHDAAPPAAGR